jgi:hypothetical protein
VRRFLAALVLVTAAASIPGAAANRGIGLSASPLRVTLRDTSAAVITVRNPGGRALRVDVGTAGFARSLSGRPRVRPGGKEVAWLRVRPRRFRIAAGGATKLHIVARPPRNAAPGDHPAVALLTTRPLGVHLVRLRLQVGVIVVLHVRGRIVRRLEARSLRVRPAPNGRTLQLLLVNRGNVTERLGNDGLRLVLLRSGHVVATLRPHGRELLPRSEGLAEFAYRGGIRGDVVARVEARATVHVPMRTFHVRL